MKHSMSAISLALSGIFFSATVVQASPDDTKEKAKQDPYAVQGSGPPTFDMLKGHDKGYVTLEDAEANSWLAGNFAKCDKDKDGKLTEAEYDACQAAKPKP